VWIARRNPVATVAVFPADHFIWEEDRFEGHVRAAVAAAAHLRQVILLGVEAERPDTGYGYIAPGHPVETAPGTELYAVREFWEKPDWVTASLLLARGYLWNTFILVSGIDVFLGLAEIGVPRVLTHLRSIASCLGTPAEAAALTQAYKLIPSTNLSQVVLPRHPEALLVLASRGISWCDWGDPDRIVHTLRRFNRRPAWLPAYARTQAAMGAGLTRGNLHGKENSHATV
jgi:mannose-1-phosphate guanylyltransferase